MFPLMTEVTSIHNRKYHEELMTCLTPLSMADELPILELLTYIREDGLVPSLTCTDGITLTDAQAEELLARLRQKGYESTLSESRRTGMSFDACEAKYHPGVQYEIRHAMTCLECDDHTLASGSRMLAERQFKKAGYRKRYA